MLRGRQALPREPEAAVAFPQLGEVSFGFLFLGLPFSKLVPGVSVASLQV